MSYAGTYGSDETCKHYSYWRYCMYCSLIGPNATDEQIVAVVAQRQERALIDENERIKKVAERYKSVVVRDGFGRIISETEEKE